jgi:cytochrome P450
MMIMMVVVVVVVVVVMMMMLMMMMMTTTTTMTMMKNPNAVNNNLARRFFSFVSGYHVERGTLVFVNNYAINTSEKHWEAPTEFRPDRFIADGKVTRPQYFIPFSTGKRTCIGQRLVQGFSFLLTASILQHFDVTSSDPSSIRTYTASLAVPMDTFPLTFTPRKVSFVHSA